MKDKLILKVDGEKIKTYTQLLSFKNVDNEGQIILRLTLIEPAFCMFFREGI